LARHYLEWIKTLEETDDYRVMVSGFLNSKEYRQRFRTVAFHLLPLSQRPLTGRELVNGLTLEMNSRQTTSV
jgi:hypothetical protein